MTSSSYLLFLHQARRQLQLLSRQIGNCRSHSSVHLSHALHPHALRPYLYCRLYCQTRTSFSARRNDTVDSHDKGVKDEGSKKAQVRRPLEHEKRNEVIRASETRTDKYASRSDSASVSDPLHASEYLRQSWINHYNVIATASETPKRHSEPPHSQIKGNKSREAKDDLMKDENTFGILSSARKGRAISEFPDMRNPNERISEALPEDVDTRRDRRLNIPLTREGRIGKKSYYYTKKISLLGREGKIREAIDVFEQWMMVRDRVMPTKRTFVALIGILGRVGYVDKAFELFRKMKQLGLDPEDQDHIYTSLFNACANSPSHADGLRKAEKLLHEMKDEGIQPNLFTVKAGMKAFALCGDFPRAFALLDDASTRIRLDSECFDHLLMACISDKKAGFRRSLQVWQKMVEYRIQPTTQTFNLLIRSARDCGIGNPDMFITALGLNLPSPATSVDVELSDGVTQQLDILHDFREESLALESGSSNASRRKSEQNLPLISNNNRADSAGLEASKLERLDKPVDIVPLNLTDHSDTHSETCVQEQFKDPVWPHVGKDGVEKHTADTNMKKYLDSDYCDSKEGFDESLLETNNAQDGHRAKVYEWWEDEPSPSSSDDSKRILIHYESDEIRIPNQPESFSTVLEKSGSKLDATRPKRISLRDLKSPQGRLALIGGASKLLSYMEEQGIQPEVRTYAQVLACLPHSEQSELELLKSMERSGVKPDIDLLNDIMMRRNMRHQSDTVKAILPLVSKLRLTPNMRTYAALALTCHKEKQAHELLQDMKEANLEPNAEIMGHLIYISRANFTYKLHMLQAMESLGLKPISENIEVIEKSVAITKRKIIEAEKNQDVNSFYRSEHFEKSFHNFLHFYREWLIRTELDKPRHPWESFQKKPDEDESSSLAS